LHESWSDHYNLILKEREKGTLPRNVKVGGHPMESVSHGLRKKKGGEECQSFIKEHQCAKFQRIWNCSHLFIMEDSKSPLLVVDIEQPPLKINFYLCFINEKL
jgi:hypothetical protein